VGVGKARELIYTGQIIDAAEALAIGLADRVVPRRRWLAETRAAAEKIAKNAPLAVAHAKRALHAGENVPLAVAKELEIQAFALCFATEDQKSGHEAPSSRTPAPRGPSSGGEILFDATPGAGRRNRLPRGTEPIVPVGW
jgi:enoyl-CoA hydratase